MPSPWAMDSRTWNGEATVGGIAFFGNHCTNGVLYEIYDEDMKVALEVTIESLLADWQENS